jgi:hypothetical protein
MPEWARIVNTTIREYIRGEEPNVLRNRKLTALMRQKGRITFNHAGDNLDWKVRYKRAPLFGFADSDTLTFSRRNRWKTAVLPWRGYASTDSMTKKERLMNKSIPAIVNIYSNVAKLLLEDIEDNFEDELYIDGNASGNSKRLHGVESALAATQTINISTGAERTANAADKAGAPADTYAGLTTGIGDYGGTWTGSWPDGTGDAHYDFWTPVIVNTTSTAFGGATDDFAGQGDEAIRYLIIRSQKNKSRRGQLDLILLYNAWYEQLLNLLDTKERFVSRPGRNEGSLAKLGFTDVVNYDGVEVTWSFGVPDTTGYGFNVDEMELCSLQSQLFVPEGPDFDIASQSWRFSIDMYGNLKMNPRCMGKLTELA